MNLSEFDYELPEERIAQRPAEPRDSARLLVHHVASDATEHASIRDLPEILRNGDLLVVNDTRVRAARLLGRRATGGAVELLVHEIRSLRLLGPNNAGRRRHPIGGFRFCVQSRRRV